MMFSTNVFSHLNINPKINKKFGTCDCDCNNRPYYKPEQPHCEGYCIYNCGPITVGPGSTDFETMQDAANVIEERANLNRVRIEFHGTSLQWKWPESHRQAYEEGRRELKIIVPPNTHLQPLNWHEDIREELPDDPDYIYEDLPIEDQMIFVEYWDDESGRFYPKHPFECDKYSLELSEGCSVGPMTFYQDGYYWGPSPTYNNMVSHLSPRKCDNSSWHRL